MPEFQPVCPSHLAAIKRPRCLTCGHQRMLLSGIEGGRSGFYRRTFECQKCGRVQTSTASKEPVESNVLRWPGVALKRPR
jgi:hypothetical protein